jgi:hypothetical protein
MGTQISQLSLPQRKCAIVVPYTHLSTLTIFGDLPYASFVTPLAVRFSPDYVYSSDI